MDTSNKQSNYLFNNDSVRGGIVSGHSQRRESSIRMEKKDDKGANGKQYDVKFQNKAMENIMGCDDI